VSESKLTPHSHQLPSGWAPHEVSLVGPPRAVPVLLACAVPASCFIVACRQGLGLSMAPPAFLLCPVGANLRGFRWRVQVRSMTGLHLLNPPRQLERTETLELTLKRQRDLQSSSSTLLACSKGHLWGLLARPRAPTRAGPSLGRSHPRPRRRPRAGRRLALGVQVAARACASSKRYLVLSASSWVSRPWVIRATWRSVHLALRPKG
jgi:hypothetical protein